jgi:His-Xaa-Ser system protein HxsD
MNKKYNIENYKACIKLDNKIYNILPVKKTLLQFINEFYITIDLNENDEINIVLIKKDKKEIKDNDILKIYNELLCESLRYDISIQTKDIRELIIGRALYSTCIDTDLKNESQEITEDYELDNISKNWFEDNK